MVCAQHADIRFHLYDCVTSICVSVFYCIRLRWHNFICIYLLYCTQHQTESIHTDYYYYYYWHLNNASLSKRWRTNFSPPSASPAYSSTTTTINNKWNLIQCVITHAHISFAWIFLLCRVCRFNFAFETEFPATHSHSLISTRVCVCLCISIFLWCFHQMFYLSIASQLRLISSFLSDATTVVFDSDMYIDRNKRKNGESKTNLLNHWSASPIIGRLCHTTDWIQSHSCVD